MSLLVGRMKTIMVVDDEFDVLENVKLFLRHEDVEVVTATNNRSALEQLDEKNEDAFDLILVNTQFPGKKNSSALFSMKPTSKEEINRDENFLQKPFTKEQFIEFIKMKINET